jgi:hypothetical protein
MALAQEKQRRMDLRRLSGSRRLPESSTMPLVRGPRYLVAHACFSCRRSFKVAPRPERMATCPRCGGVLCEMGRSFKAPRAPDREQWAKVQALYAAGFRFFSYRSQSCPALPARLSEVEAFIRENPGHPYRVAEPNPSLHLTFASRLRRLSPAGELKR